MVEPPPPYGDTESVDNITDNRIQQRRNILNELDLIKTRVNQIIQKYEENHVDKFLEASTMSVSLKETLEDLLWQYEAFRASKEKELSSARNFFGKYEYLTKYLKELTISIAEERMSNKSVLEKTEFETTLCDTAQMLQQLKSLNTQMIKYLSNIIENQKLQLQYGLVSSNGLRSDEIIQMYTNEATKCDKLERMITTINDELNLLKTQNIHLTEQVEADILKLQETNESREELKETIKELRFEIDILKYKKPTTEPLKEDHIDNDNQLHENAPKHHVTADDEEKPQIKTLNVSSSNTISQRNKSGPSRVALQAKKRIAKKFTSKLLDQQLDYVEELMVQGQQSNDTSEKQLFDLAHAMSDILLQKYREEYTCLYDAVGKIINLLGTQGSEKMMTALGCAAPEYLLPKQGNVHESISSIKTGVSQVMSEIKSFIIFKKKQAAPSKLDSKILKGVKQIQKGLVQTLNRINGDINESIELYEFDKKKVEDSQIINLDQIKKKLETNAQKLTKTMEKLELPDQTKVKAILDTAVADMTMKPTNSLLQTHVESSSLAVDEDKDNSASIIVCNMPVIDQVRKDIAGHLKDKHNVTISSMSWRAHTDKKPKLPPIKGKNQKTSKRKRLVPTLATCVEYGKHRGAMRVPIRASDMLQRLKVSEGICHTTSKVKHQPAFPTITKKSKLMAIKRK